MIKINFSIIIKLFKHNFDQYLIMSFSKMLIQEHLSDIFENNTMWYITDIYFRCYINLFLILLLSNIYLSMI